MKQPSRVLAAAAVAAISAFAIGLDARADTSAPLATVTVNISANCAGEGVTVSISPWEAVVQPGDDLEWAIAGADSMSIMPLRGWPFSGPPGLARANARGRAGTLPESANARRGERFPYQVILFCGGRRIIIDPDVVIGDEN